MADKDLPGDTNPPPKNQSNIAGRDEERLRWLEQEYADEEREEHQRSVAIEKMLEWFYYHFEDPQNETPRVEGEFLFMWGGPFDASEVLFDHFIGEYERDLIRGAVEEVQKNGTYEWAPTVLGDFYEHPDADENSETQRTIVSRESLIASISILKNQLGDLETRPKTIGHNQPPEEIGSPPYADDDKGAIAELLENAEIAISSDNPEINRIQNLTAKLDEFALRALKYAGSKVDIVIDETLKKGTTITLAYLTFGEYLQEFIRSVKVFFGF